MTSAEFSYLASIGYAGSVADKRNAYYNDLIRTSRPLPPPLGAGQDDTARIQAAINQPWGGVIECNDTYRVGQIDITSAVTIIGKGKGEFVSIVTGTTTMKMFNITASGVELNNFKITGPQFAAAANQTGINAVGTSGTAPITDLKLLNLNISNFGKNGIFAQYVKGFKFNNNTVKNCCYSGIGVLSLINGCIDYNVVQNITQTGYANSYGIYTTRNEVDVTAADPRSENISICHNQIFDIPLWDGINTHAGKNHTISDNIIINVAKPIELVACQGTGGAEKYAPIDMKVIGNIISSTVTDGSRAAGIMLVGADGVGAGGGVGNPAEWATGIISGNIIRGHGVEGTGISGAIVLYYTKGVPVTGNTIIEPSPAGIQFYHSNSGFICTGNTIIDPWTTNGTLASAISFNSQYNTGRTADNILRLNGKTATIVANRGVYINSSATNSIDLGSNDMSAATIPVSDSGKRGFSDSNVIGLWSPQDNLFIACDTDPSLASGSWLVPTAGVIYLRKMKMAESKAITNVIQILTVAGVTLANTFVGVLDSAGNLLGTSADQSTAFQSTGTKTVALVAPTAVQPAGSYIYIAILVGSFATAPTYGAFPSGRMNLNITSSNARFGSILTGQTSLPGSITPGSIVGITSGATPLVALS